MIPLIKKDFYLGRALYWVSGILGIAMVPLFIAWPEIGLFTSLFYQFILAHMMFNLARQGRTTPREDQLLISLPIGRDRIVSAKYAYCAIWAMGHPLYLTLMLALCRLLGLAVPASLVNMWVLLSAMALIYLTLMMPLSYFNQRYAAALSLLLYLAVLFLPQKLIQWFGSAADGRNLSERLFTALAGLGPWLMPLLLLAVLAVYLASMKLSQYFYRRQDV